MFQLTNVSKENSSKLLREFSENKLLSLCDWFLSSFVDCAIRVYLSKNTRPRAPAQYRPDTKHN